MNPLVHMLRALHLGAFLMALAAYLAVGCLFHWIFVGEAMSASSAATWGALIGWPFIAIVVSALFLLALFLVLLAYHIIWSALRQIEVYVNWRAARRRDEKTAAWAEGLAAAKATFSQTVRDGEAPTAVYKPGGWVAGDRTLPSSADE